MPHPIPTNVEQASAAEYFLGRLVAFVEAGERLSEAWQQTDHTGAYWAAGYPSYLPSFDDFIADARAWLDEVS